MLAEQNRAASSCETLNETLEQRVEERATELNDARETLAFALESAGMGTWDLDLHQTPPAERLRHDQIFGYEESAAIVEHRLFLDHVVEEDRQAVEAAH